MSVQLKVERCLDKYEMLKDIDTVVIGVSGGADSVCLLNVMNNLSNKFGYKIVVCHVNHSIRLTGTAERDANFVKDICTQLDIEYRLKKVDIPAISKELGLTEEEAGRIERYKFFHEVGKELSGERYAIATGANANDSVETLLMRVIRGTTVSGLASIPYVNGKVIRPLLDVTRAEIENYLEENGLTHITDETNNETIFTRNKIRLELLPWIQENMNPNVMETITSNIKRYKEDAEYIDLAVEELYTKSVKKVGDKVRINLSEFKDSHVSISKRVLLRVIKEIIGSESIGFNGTILENIVENLDKAGNSYSVCNNCTANIGRDYITLYNPNKMESKDGEVIDVINYDDDKEIIIDGFGKIVAHTEVVENFENNEKVLYIPKNLIKDKTLSVRYKREGDRFAVVYDKMHKKLNKLMCDLHIDALERDNQVLVTLDNTVLSIAGVKSSRFEQRSGECLRITFEPLEV